MTGDRFALELCNQLNIALDIDPETVAALFEKAVTCKTQLAKYAPTWAGANGERQIGVIGLINGVFGKEGRGICATRDERGRILRFVAIED